MQSHFALASHTSRATLRTASLSARRRRLPRRLLSLGFLSCLTLAAHGEDWNQWRGARRDGVAAGGPALRGVLPDTGLKPVWIHRSGVPSANSGGWSSPVVAGGKVYTFVHRRDKSDASPPKKKFPWLPPEKRTGMSDAEYEAYEQNRRDEDQEIARFYQFDEIVYCWSADDGGEVWSNERKSVYTRFPQSGSPTVVDGRLYVLGAGRVARCIDANTGQTIWDQRLPGPFRDEYMQSSFLIVRDKAIVLCGQVFALDTATGEVAWSSDADSTAGTHSSPVVWNDGPNPRVIVNVGEGQTACFDPNNGQELWRVRSDASHSTPVVVGDQLLTYGSSRRGGLRRFALSSAGAEQKWVFQELADSGSSPVALDGCVYVQGDRKVACVDMETGKANWIANLEMARPRYTSLVAGDGKLFYTFDGLLAFAASPDAFQLLTQAKINRDGLLAGERQFRELMKMDALEATSEGRKEALQLWNQTFKGQGPLPCASPALLDGRLYIRLEDGLACYDLRK